MMNARELAFVRELFRVRRFAEGLVVGQCDIEALKYTLSNVDADRNARSAQREFDSGVRTFGRVTVDDAMNVVSVEIPACKDTFVMSDEEIARKKSVLAAFGIKEAEAAR